MLAVGANSKNPEKALQVIELLQTDPVLFNLLAWGIEGVHYELDEDGYLVKIPGNPYETCQNNAWAVGNPFLRQPLVGDTVEPTDTEARLNLYKELNSKGKVNSIFGMSIDATAVQTELAAVNEVVASYGNYWFLNCDDIEETLNEILDKCYDAGLQTVLDEYNKQTLAWWETNHQ